MIKNINWGLLIGLFALNAQADLAYVTDISDEIISVIDTSTNSVVGTVPVGPSGPYCVDCVAVNTAGTRIYVANYSSGSSANGTVSVIDTSNNSVVATLTLKYSPYSLVVNPSGTRLYVANNQYETWYGLSGALVNVIDTSNNRVVANIQIGNGSNGGIAINPAGTRLYVVNRYNDSNNIIVIDTVTNSIVTSLNVEGYNSDVVVNPAGTRFYVKSSVGINVIDTSNNSVIATVKLASVDGSLAINPAGTRLYAVSGDYSVGVIDTSTNRLITTVGVGTKPRGIAVNRSGSHVYVVNSGSGDVSVIDTSNNSVVATIVVGTSPVGIAMMGSTTATDYTVMLNKNGNGSVNGGGNFAAGTPVNLTATPDAGYKFVGWSPSPCANSFAMPAQNLTCTATFEKTTTTTVPQTSTQCAPYNIFARPQVFIPCVNIGNVTYQAGLNLFANSPSLRFEVDLNSLVINNLIPTAQCAVFPAPNTLDHLRINCLDISTDKYWVDLQLVVQPNVVQFDVVNFGSLLSGIYSGTKTYTTGSEQGTTYNISMTLLEASSILKGTYTLKSTNSNSDCNLSGTKEGNAITLTADIPSCAHVFVGTINGNTMSGTMTTENNCNGSGSWSVSK